MSYTTLGANALKFASSPASPNAFAIFAPSSSPRETRAMYAEFRQVLGVCNGQRQHGKSALKKLFGAK